MIHFPILALRSLCHRGGGGGSSAAGMAAAEVARHRMSLQREEAGRRRHRPRFRRPLKTDPIGIGAGMSLAGVAMFVLPGVPSA